MSTLEPSLLVIPNKTAAFKERRRAGVSFWRLREGWRSFSVLYCRLGRVPTALGTCGEKAEQCES